MCHGNKSFINREGNANFDVLMRSFDGAEVCELVGTYILRRLNTTVFENENMGLYWDNGVGTFRNLSGPEIERNDKAKNVGD